MIHFKKSLLFLLFLAGGITVSAQNAAPQIIPAVKEWRGSSGSFSFKSKPKLVIRQVIKHCFSRYCKYLPTI